MFCFSLIWGKTVHRDVISDSKDILNIAWNEFWMLSIPEIKFWDIMKDYERKWMQTQEHD